jgi:hypothetical protein
MIFKQTTVIMKKLLTILSFLLISLASLSAQVAPANYERVKDFMSNPTVLMLKSDGQFELVTGSTSIVGTYTFADGSITFSDAKGNYSDIMAGTGSYQVVPTANGVQFKVVKDKAIQRKDVLSQSDWKKVGDLMGN